MSYKPMSKESISYFQSIGIIKKPKRVEKNYDLIYLEGGKVTEVICRNKTYKYCSGLKKYYSNNKLGYVSDNIRIISEQYKKEHKLQL